MKLKDIYRLAVERGLANDPRSSAQIREDINRAKKEFAKLKGTAKKCYDTERLKHPYADTRILYGDPDTDVKTVMLGIDMEGPELLTAAMLNNEGAGIDLVIAHHPEGLAWAGFYEVMHMQAMVLEKFGIPLEVGKDLLKERIGEVQRAVSPANHFRSVDIARLLGIPYMCVHTPADNHVVTYLQKLCDSKKPARVSDVIDLLLTIPEYIDAARKNAGPRILAGDAKKKAGKVFVDMTGGTEGSKKVFARLSQAGVGTIVAMHLSEEHYKQAKDEHLNLVIAGHIASDTLGLNLLLDSLVKKQPLKIIPCSGFIRVRR